MFAGPLGRSTFTPPKSSFDSPLYGLVSLRRSHKRFYSGDSGEVTDSKLLQQSGNDYRVFLRLQKHKIITVVLNTQHTVRYHRLDSGRVYSHSYSTAIREVRRPGKPNEAARGEGPRLLVASAQLLALSRDTPGRVRRRGRCGADPRSPLRARLADQTDHPVAAEALARDHAAGHAGGGPFTQLDSQSHRSTTRADGVPSPC